MKYIITIILGLILGAFTNFSTIDKELNKKIINPTDFTIETIAGDCNGDASCDCIFAEPNSCNKSTASCGGGGTGYNLSCTIKCDNQSSIDCGEVDPEYVTLLDEGCKQ